MEALASASASREDATAWSKSPASAAFLAAAKAAAARAHAARRGAIVRHRIEDPERGRQHLGANPLARVLHMTARAGEIELPAPRIEIAFAVLIGFERTRVIGDFDVERLAAGRERHISG